MEDCMSSVPYASMIKFNGRPILPPLMNTEKRQEMQEYKKQASLIETRIALRKYQKLKESHPPEEFKQERMKIVLQEHQKYIAMKEQENQVVREKHLHDLGKQSEPPDTSPLPSKSPIPEPLDHNAPLITFESDEASLENSKCQTGEFACSEHELEQILIELPDNQVPLTDDAKFSPLKSPDRFPEKIVENLKMPPNKIVSFNDVENTLASLTLENVPSKPFQSHGSADQKGELPFKMVPPFQEPFTNVNLLSHEKTIFVDSPFGKIETDFDSLSSNLYNSYHNVENLQEISTPSLKHLNQDGINKNIETQPFFPILPLPSPKVPSQKDNFIEQKDVFNTYLKIDIVDNYLEKTESHDCEEKNITYFYSKVNNGSSANSSHSHLLVNLKEAEEQSINENNDNLINHELSLKIEAKSDAAINSSMTLPSFSSSESTEASLLDNDEQKSNTPPKRVRRNSYTLENPSPALVKATAQAKLQSDKNSADSYESLLEFTRSQIEFLEKQRKQIRQNVISTAEANQDASLQKPFLKNNPEFLLPPSSNFSQTTVKLAEYDATKQHLFETHQKQMESLLIEQQNQWQSLLNHLVEKDFAQTPSPIMNSPSNPSCSRSLFPPEYSPVIASPSPSFEERSHSDGSYHSPPRSPTPSQEEPSHIPLSYANLHYYSNKENSSFLHKTQDLQLLISKLSFKLPSLVKGYLTRRLLKTKHVKNIIGIIKDTLQCAVDFHNEPPIKSGQVTPKDTQLHQQLIDQLNNACFELYDIFHDWPIKQRMDLIAQDRQKQRSPQPPPWISKATLKCLQRKMERKFISSKTSPRRCHARKSPTKSDCKFNSRRSISKPFDAPFAKERICTKIHTDSRYSAPLRPKQPSSSSLQSSKTLHFNPTFTKSHSNSSKINKSSSPKIQKAKRVSTLLKSKGSKNQTFVISPYNSSINMHALDPHIRKPFKPQGKM